MVSGVIHGFGTNITRDYISGVGSLGGGERAAYNFRGSKGTQQSMKKLQEESEKEWHADCLFV